MKEIYTNLQHSFFKQQRMIFFATPSGPEGYTPAEQTEDNHAAEKKDEPKDLATQKQEIEDGIQTIMKQGSDNLKQYKDADKLVEALNKDTIAKLRNGVEDTINELKQQSEQIEDNSREALRTTALNALNQISGIIAKSNSPEKQQQAA